MADKTINDLTAATSLADGDLFEIENTGNNSRKITAANARNSYFRSGFLAPMTTPDDATFAWVNQGGAAVTVNGNGGIFLRAPTSAGSNVRVRKLSTGATPWTVTAAFLIYGMNLNYQVCGLVVRESGSGKLQTFGPLRGAGDSALAVQNWTNATTYSSDAVKNAFHMGGVIWLRVTDNGTNKIFYYSMDDYNFIQVLSQSRTTHLTADEVGFFVNNENATYETGCTLISWLKS